MNRWPRRRLRGHFLGRIEGPGRGVPPPLAGEGQGGRYRKHRSFRHPSPQPSPARGEGAHWSSPREQLLNSMEPAFASRLRGRRRGGEIGAATASEELAALVEHLRLRGRELAADADRLALDGEVTWHRGGVIVDAQVDGRHAA